MSQPLYSRFEHRILRTKSATDDAQVPAALGVVGLLGQGATVSQETTITGGGYGDRARLRLGRPRRG